MSFLAPYMLFGAMAAGIPIALHFFFRSRYRTVPWAAMEFLLKSIEQTSRRLRFQELILLLLRVLLLCMLAFALARPSTRAGSGSADAVDAVFLIDNSMSMAALEGSATRLERAKAAALAVIDHLPPYSTVQVISVSDQARLLGPQAPSNLDHARYLVQQLDVDHLATDFLPALQEAAGALAKGAAPNKELYLFSDMQKLGWDAEQSATTATLRAIGRDATVYLVRFGVRQPRNVSIVALSPQSTIPHTGERAAFSVLLRNTGGEPVRDLTVRLSLDGQEQDSVPVPVVEPGETKTVSLTAKLSRPGMRVITAQVATDELPADNRFDRVLHVRDLVRVLIVDGTPNERDPEKAGSYFLFHAVRPVAEAYWERYHVQPRVVRAGQAAPELLDDVQVCLFANVSLQPGSDGGAPSAAFLDRLEEFVRSGGGLVIFAGANVSDGARRLPEAYNRELFEERRLLPCRIAGDFRIAPDRPVRLDPASIESLSFLRAFREEPLNAIGQVDLLQALSVDAASLQTTASSSPPRVDLRDSDGRPAVLSQSVSEGEVILVTTSGERTWSDWPIRQTFLPFVDITLGHLLRGPSRQQNLMAGEELHWRLPPGEAGKAFVLITPNETRERLGEAEVQNGRPMLRTSETRRAGLYRLEPESLEDRGANDEPVPFAVTPDLREVEDLSVLSDAELDGRLGFRPIHVNASENLSAIGGAARLQHVWTVWLLLGVLGLALAETAFAWWCGRGW
jgi:hypothetical protein